MWKNIFRETGLFVLDLSIVFFSVLLFSIHLSMLLFIPFAPNVKYSLPSTLFCLALVIVYKLFRWVLVRAEKIGGATALDAVFLGFFTLLGALSLALTSRMVFFQISFPKILVVITVLAAFGGACFLFRWWRWRTVPLFLIVILVFNFFILRISRYTIEERDLLPLSRDGVKVVRMIENPDEPAPPDQRPGMNARILDLMKSFAGFLMASHQFGYVYVGDEGRFLYASEFNVRTGMTDIFKIRLDDYHTTASIHTKGYFRDMILDRTGQDFIATNFIRREICYYRNDDLALQECLNLGVPSVLNLLELPDGGLVVSSEHGFVTRVGPDRKIRSQVRPSVFCEEMALDETGETLLIGSMGGYTFAELDLGEMRLTRKTFPAISICGIALDTGGDRIFLPRLLLGDLVVLDAQSLDPVARVPLAPGLRAVCYIPEKNLVAVGNYFNGNLYIVDGSDYRVLGTLWIGSKNRSMKYSAERDRLYVQTVNRILEIDLDRILPTKNPLPPGREGPSPAD